VDVAKGIFAAGTTRVDLPFEPTAIMLWWTRQADHGVRPGSSGGIGFWAGGAARAAAWASDDGAAATRTSRCADEVAVIGLSPAQPVLSGTIVATDGSGFALEWTGAGPWLVHYLALGGVTGAKVGWLADEVETGFAPDFVLVAPVSVEKPHTLERGLVAGLGAAAATGQAGATYTVRDCAAPGEVGGAELGSAAVIAVASRREFDALGRISLQPRGFSVAWERRPPTPRFHPYLAVGGIRCAIGMAVSPRKPGRRRTRGVQFRPEALIVFSWGLAPRLEPADIGRLCIGAGTDEAVGCAGWDDRNVEAQATMTHVSSSAEDALLITNTRTGTLHAAGRLRSLDRRGFTLDWWASDGSEREFAYVALAAAPDSPKTARKQRGEAEGNLPGGLRIA
jgi:hypothetical protein